MGNAVLHGRKVVLRSKRIGDAWNDYKWRCDKELSQLDASSPMRMSFDEYLQFYKDNLRQPILWDKRFAIDTLKGKHIGNCAYYAINTVSQEAELGILIGSRAYWSTGYGYDALHTMVNHIFQTLPINRLYLHTLSWNARAQRCFAKCGFLKVRPVLRDGNEFILMELLRQGWEKSCLRGQREHQVSQKSVTA